MLVLYSLAKVMEITNAFLNRGDIRIVSISEAPWWIRLLSKRSYFLYNDIIYVPDDHMTLSKSKSLVDNTLATAKLLPWIMMRYNKQDSLLDVMITKLTDRYIYYFAYEYMFLLYSENPLTKVVLNGFLLSRTDYMGRVIPPSDTLLKLTILLENGTF